MASETLTFDAVHRGPSLYETVSERILHAIREAKLAPGTRIPSERDLGDQFGVSRTVIREAIRHLAAKGVLEVVSGSGVLVADIGHEGVVESIDLYLRQRGVIEPELIHEVRESLELKTVALAAERATDAQLQEIDEICEAMGVLLDDPEASSDADLAFHRAIAAATGNNLFLVLVDSLNDVMLQIRRATLVDPERGKVALAAHRRIVEALRTRDQATATGAMKDHLDDSLGAFRRAVDGPGA